MKNNYTSIVLCTYNRAHLLKRSLVCYEKQTVKDFELVILDDNSQDNTFDLVEEYKDKLNIKYMKMEDKKPDEWRDAASIINKGIKLTEGEYIYITHPEVMISFDCIEKLNKTLKNNPQSFVNCRTYYLTLNIQKGLDGCDWQTDFYNVRKIKGFYDEKPLYQEEELAFLNKECTTTFAETAEVWYSWVFGGMTRRVWKDFGGLNEYNTWGSVDADFMERRASCNINTVTPEGVFVIHQNHDEPFGAFKPTKRSIKLLYEDVKNGYNKKVNFLEDMEC